MLCCIKFTCPGIFQKDMGAKFLDRKLVRNRKQFDLMSDRSLMRHVDRKFHISSIQYSTLGFGHNEIVVVFPSFCSFSEYKVSPEHTLTSQAA